ncbi:DUF1127 domain-containing protein [Planktomarina sp.]|uniref:DUF1127 domain-containing protein n=1 Tax=Planktomarina sp. TaxID=2024851 RepID=UPI003260F109
MYLTYDYPSQFKLAVIATTKRTLKAVAKFFISVGNSLAKAQQMRADYYLLNNMSDKQLKDIGVTRGEIKQRFYGTDSET